MYLAVTFRRPALPRISALVAALITLVTSVSVLIRKLTP